MWTRVSGERCHQPVTQQGFGDLSSSLSFGLAWQSCVCGEGRSGCRDLQSGKEVTGKSEPGAEFCSEQTSRVCR